MESVSLPSQLPLLPIYNQVLLPTAFVRVQISLRASRSVALLESLVKSPSKDLLLAVVPGLTTPGQGLRDADGRLPLPPNGSGATIGTAARVLQLSRLVQSGDWVLLLEGLCRITINSYANSSTADPYDLVNITQLELAPPVNGSSTTPLTSGATAATGGHSSSTVGGAPLSTAAAVTGGEGGAGEEDAAEVADLGRQLKASTQQLLRLLSQQTGLPTVVRRLLELLDAVPPWRAADVVAAALGRTTQDRLAVLMALDHRTRITLALRLVDGALSALQGPGGASTTPTHNTTTSTSTPSVSGGQGGGQKGRQAGASRPTPLLPRGGSGGRVGQGAGRRRGAFPGGGSSLGGGWGGGGGEEEEEEDEVAVLLERVAAAHPPPEVLKAAAKEARRLQSGGEQQPGAAAARAYLECLADLPWSITSRDKAAAAARGAVAGGDSGSSSTTTPGQQLGATAPGASSSQSAVGAGRAPGGVMLPLPAARAVLDAHHAGLTKVKTRIIQQLAVMRLKGGSAKAPILCLIGPPGVGKTSLARSIAEVLGVPFTRIALGGVRDEAEIRGHRRTYIGALPGRLIQGVRKAGVKDPLILLDEIDKMGRDHRGDPAAALLEVLDPEQNRGFVDTYLGLPFDLSSATFVCTANREDEIPRPLMDRLEVIQLAGYTLEEKVHIAQQHLLPQLLSDHGLGPQMVEFPPDVLVHLVKGYTREAGVRNLSRALAAVCRHIACDIVMQQEGGGAEGAAGDRGQGAQVQTLGTADAAAAFGAPLQHQQHHHQQQQPEQELVNVWPPPANALSCRSASAPGSDPDLAAWEEQLPKVVLPPPSPDTNLGVTTWARRRQEPAAPRVLPHSQHKQQQAALQLGPLLQQEEWAACPATGPVGASAAGAAGACVEASGGSAPGTAPAHLAGSSSSSSSKLPPVRSLLSALRLSNPPHHHQQQQPLAHPADTSAVMHHPHHLQQQQQQPPAGVRANSGAIGYQGLGVQGAPYPPDLLAQRHQLVVVDASLVTQVLGPVKFQGTEVSEQVAAPGAAAGLVWTAAGGGVQFIECVRVSEGAPGRPGQLTLTGQLGEVLEESVRIALSWIRAHAYELNLDGALPVQGSAAGPAEGKEEGGNGGGGRGGGGVEWPGLVDQMGLQPLTARHRAATARGAGLAGQLMMAAGPQEGDRSSSSRSSSSSRQQLLGGQGSTATAGRSSSSDSRWLHGAEEVGQELVAEDDLPVETPTATTSSSSSRSATVRVIGDPLQLSAAPTAGVGGAGAATCLSPAHNWDIHVHLPAGAVPKDGPSAGVTLAVALVSLMSGRRVRSDTAMTGELTLRGLVLPVGGVKEKLLAARAAGLRRVLVPARNMAEVEMEAGEALRGGELQVIPVGHVGEALASAFEPPYLLMPRSRM